MNTIAVTVWNGIVSPVFDTARMLLIIMPDGTRQTAAIDMPDLAGRIAALKFHGVTSLICGAISNAAIRMISLSGVRVIPWMCGPVDEVVRAYQQGTLSSGLYVMPGCGRQWCCGGMRRRRHGHGLKLKIQKSKCETLKRKDAYEDRGERSKAGTG